jgi:hypothetical protein
MIRAFLMGGSVKVKQDGGAPLALSRSYRGLDEESGAA